MNNLTTLTPAELRRAAVIQEQIEALNHELAKVLNGSSAPVPKAAPDANPVKTKKKYKLSAEGRAKKIAALKARWAKANLAKTGKTEAAPMTEVVAKNPRKRGMSEEGKARIVAAQKARWAKVKAAKGALPGQTEAKPVKGGKVQASANR